MGTFETLLNTAVIADLKKSIGLFMPEILLIITFVIAILADLIFKKARKIAGVISLAGFLVTGIYMMNNAGASEATFMGMFAVDPFSMFFKYLFLLSGIAVTLMSFFSEELYKENRSMGEYYTLILGMTIGMFAIVGANNLIVVYLALETMSLSSYVLSGYTKEIKRASEASLKYVIYGSLSSGIMIWGISLLFGLTGSLSFFEINAALSQASGNHVALLVASLMILAGFAYKISAVPFHFWTPDVYEGAPVSITAYLSVASKAAGFAALMRFIYVGFINFDQSTSSVYNMLAIVDWKFLITVLSVITMTIGNLVALWQNNVKRILAYSGIAHAGYLLMGVVVMNQAGIIAVLIYFASYLIMNFGAFFVVQMIADKVGSEDLDEYVGMGYRAPALGTTLTIFLISLTGLPPTVGFIGKFYLFAAVLDSGLIWLAVVGVLNSVVSLYYYSKIFRNMWVRGVDNDNPNIKYSIGAQVLMYALAVPTIFYGLYATPLVAWAESSFKMLIGR